MKKKRDKFREMLDEITTLELTSTWKDIKKIIRDDPRYLKYSNSDKVFVEVNSKSSFLIIIFPLVWKRV